MALRLRRPSASQLAVIHGRAVGEDITFDPGRLSSDDGFTTDRSSRALGHGAATFERAAEALGAWEMHRRAGLSVYSPTGPEVGSTVAMSAPLPVAHIDLTCRVLEVVDEPARCGFAYGTLPNHPEVGEESFIATIDSDGTVSLDIVARWKLRHPLGRLAPPIAKWLQRRATECYLDAMESIIASQ